MLNNNASLKELIDAFELVDNDLIDRGLGQTITPSTSNKVLQRGNYRGDIIIKGDINLIPSNIKESVSIFGVVGNLKIPEFVCSTPFVITSENSSSDTILTKYDAIAGTTVSSLKLTSTSGFRLCAGSSPTESRLFGQKNSTYQEIDIETLKLKENKISLTSNDRLKIVYDGTGLNYYAFSVTQNVVCKVDPKTSAKLDSKPSQYGEPFFIYNGEKVLVFLCQNRNTVLELDPNDYNVIKRTITISNPETQLKKIFGIYKDSEFKMFILCTNYTYEINPNTFEIISGKQYYSSTDSDSVYSTSMLFDGKKYLLAD